jgi:hypothetical protein
MGCVTEPHIAAIPLHGRLDRACDAEPMVLQLTGNTDEVSRSNRALIVRRTERPLDSGYGAYVCFDRRPSEPPFYSMPDELAYLEVGDVVRISPRQAHVWVM